MAEWSLNTRFSPTALVSSSDITALASRADSFWLADHLNSLWPGSIGTPNYAGAV